MASWDDEDITLGNVEIGESLRGLNELIGALQARKLQLGAGLGAAAQSRFGRHAPLQRTLRSPYKDGTQISIKCQGTFYPSSWSGTTLPTVSGLTRVYKSFKPEKAILTEIVIATYQNDSLGTRTKSTPVTNASDLVMTSAFAGADNCFPNAPTEDNGIAGPTFANTSLGNGISWPTINGGIDMTVGFAIEETAQYAVDPPSGYTQDDLVSLVVKVRLALLGPSLR